MFPTIVGDIDLFMNALAHDAIDGDTERLGIDDAALCIDDVVGQVETRGVKTELAGIDWDQRRAVDVEPIIAKKAGIHRIDALSSIGIDFAPSICDHKGS